jgi:hypothetical protein
MFENEIKMKDLKSEDKVFILFEIDNPDYYVLLRTKEEIEESLYKIYKELSEEHGTTIDITKFLDEYIIVEGNIKNLKHINTIDEMIKVI